MLQPVKCGISEMALPATGCSPEQTCEGYLRIHTRFWESLEGLDLFLCGEQSLKGEKDICVKDLCPKGGGGWES